jgi:DNA-binding IclR family transcriptional regulator
MEAGEEIEGTDAAGDTWHVARTMRALEMLSLQPLSAPQLAAAVDSHTRTMRRVLERLVAEGYVQRSGGTRRVYQPTMRLVALAAQVLENSPVARRGRPYIELLHERTRVASHLMAPSYGQVVCLCHAATGAQDEHPHLRELIPAHATAGGKVLLAHRESWRRALLGAGLEAFTDRTITDPARLEGELEQVRADGHAIEDGEYQAGVRAVAAPVSFGGEVVAAVSAAGRRLDIDAVLPHVLRAARDLTQDLADGERG